MLVLRQRLAIAGVVTAAVIAIPVAALASGPGSPAGKAAPPQPPAASKLMASKLAAGKLAAGKPGAGKPGTGKPAPPSQSATALAGIAASAGISESRLQAGLMAAKRAGGNTAAGVAAFAAAAAVPQATAQRVVDAVFGTEAKRPGLTGPSLVGALAAQLGVSRGAAQHALDQIEMLGRGGIGPASPAFAGIARGLGVSPARLAAALDTVKRSMAGR